MKEEEVVISGIGGFFPKAKNIEVLQKLILDNQYLLDTIWKTGERGVTNVLGRMPDVKFFDTAYFGIHRQQCIHMDPMQRLMMERTFEALIDAGVNPVDIRGKRVGVFVGSSVGENDNLFYESVISGFGVTGHSRSMMPNRISYWLNLKGPSYDFDCNWLNGLVALQMAYDAIKAGHCESVIVGTANFTVNPEISWIYHDAKLLSPDGITRTFDENANGYGRSDGIVVFYVQRKSVAKRSYASIVRVQNTFNGDRDGPLMEFNQQCMVNFIRDFYKGSEIDPSEIKFVEAAGSALPHLDEIEVGAIEEVYCKNRKDPLLIGSIKSNVGHSEASAASFSVVKALLALETGIILPNYNYQKPNPKIKALTDGTIKVVAEKTEWNGEYAAVNGMGLVSSFGHLLLKANSKPKKKSTDGIPRLFIASTRTEEGIKEIFNTVQTHADDPEYAAMIQDLFSKTIPGHLYRGYTLVGKEVYNEFEHYPGNKRPIWFIYSGMGSQWPKMATDLMRLPIFAESIQKCHKVLETKGLDLIKIITSDDPKIFDNILHSFVGIAAVQVALTDILFTLGIKPDGIIGHSVGELGCAYADGCLTAEQMVLAAYCRGRASLEAELIQGMMAAVGIGYQEIKNQCPPTIEVACHNGPDSCTISGPTKDMEEFVSELKKKGTFAKLVNVSNIAYHSRYIKPAAPLLLKYLQEVIPNPLPRSSKWISTSVPENKWNTDLAKTSSAEYHTNNLLNFVLFEEGSTHIPKDAIAIEIAPHGLLQAILKRSLPPSCTNIPLTQRGNKSNLEFLLTALGRMYIHGIDNMRISSIYPKIEYPVGRGTPSLTTLVHWEHSEEWRTGNEDKLNYLANVKDIQVALNTKEFKDYIGHQLDGRVVLPMSTYLTIIYKMLMDTNAVETKNIIFEKLSFRRVLSIPKRGYVPLYAMIQRGSGEFEVISEDVIVLTGVIKFPEAGENFLFDLTDIQENEDSMTVSANDFYQEFQHRGCQYSGPFKSIKSLHITEQGSIATMNHSTDWTILLDVILQQMLFHSGEVKQEIVIPRYIQRIAISLDDIPPPDQDFRVNYNFSTGMLYTQGIQIQGVKPMPLPKEPKEVLYNSLEFVPFDGSIYKYWEGALNMCVQIILNVHEYQDTASILVVEIETENKSLVDKVKNTFSKNSHINLSYSSTKDPNQIVASQLDPLFIIHNDRFNCQIANYLTHSHAFILTQTDPSIFSYPHIVQVARFFTNEKSYSLLRKVVDVVPLVIDVQGDTLSLKDLTRSNLQWVSRLKNTLENLLPKQKVYLVSTVSPVEGFYNFTQEAQGHFENNESLRFVFFTGKNTKTFQELDIAKQDMVLTVVKDGQVGSQLLIPREFKEDLRKPQYSTNVISNNNIRYMGFNLKDETHGITNPELGNIDYSGVDKSNQKVMGLAYIDKTSFKIIPDSILQWPLPQFWSLEDGATVPHAYSMAYYCLLHIAKLKPGETVLIHCGCTGIGFAAITIALEQGCKIYTTVATDQQRNFILKKFTRLTESQVLSSEDSSFEPKLLLATAGVGANVILNTLEGSLLHASLRCLSAFGRFVQLGQRELQQDSSIGLGIFLKNTSFYSIPPEALFTAPTHVKKFIHECIKNGLVNNCVRRLNRDVLDQFEIEDVLTSLSQRGNITRKVLKLPEKLPTGLLNAKDKNRFFCDSRLSYLLLGGDSEAWTDLTEWLVLRGAKKIVVASEHRPQQAHITRRLALLQTHFNADIVYTPVNISTKESAKELISEASMIGAIHAVFLLPYKNRASSDADSKAVQYLDAALRAASPKSLVVSFLKNLAGLIQKRSEAGFPTCYIEWLHGFEFSDVLSVLDETLSIGIQHLLIRNKDVEAMEEESIQMLHKKLNILLPTSVEELRQQLIKASDEPNFYQVSSLTPLKARELPPLFIVPGLAQHKTAEGLATKLLYPTYYANFSAQCLSLKEIADRLVQDVEEIQPKGTVNIVGISWGGSVATEIAKILEQKGRSIQLYYIDGAPDTIRSALTLLGTGIKKDIAIITRFLNVNDAEVLNKLNQLPGWKERIQLVFDSINLPEETRAPLGEALTILMHRIDEMLNYNFNHQEPIKGAINLIRPTGSSKYDNCGLSKICMQAIDIMIENGDHMSILQNKSTADTINRKVKC